MLKKILIALGGFVLIVVSLGAYKAAQLKEMSSAPHVMPAMAVSTMAASEVEWSPSIHAIGTLAPVEGIMLSADADGTIEEIIADSGANVKQGDLIVKFDTSVEVAQLAAAEARAELALLQSKRATDLLGKNTISQAEADSAVAQLEQAHAEVAALKAQIAKKQVRAPFSGRIGIRRINAGQFVARGAPLMPLQKLNPIFVNFDIPQRQLSALRTGQNVTVTVDAFVGQKFMANVSAINSEINASTRNIGVQAIMPNTDEKLRSGMFVKVEVELPSVGTMVAVPSTAIIYASYGNSVYIVENMKDADGKEYLGARQQFVKLGATRGDLVAISEGVKSGDRIVVSGAFKLRNGVAVQVNNVVQPTSSANPTPENT